MHVIQNYVVYSARRCGSDNVRIGDARMLQIRSQYGDEERGLACGLNLFAKWLYF
jgi:hypothetical protein